MNEIINKVLDKQFSVLHHSSENGLFLLFVKIGNITELMINVSRSGIFVIGFFQIDFEFVVQDVSKFDIFYKVSDNPNYEVLPKTTDDIFNFNLVHSIDISNPKIGEFVHACHELYHDELYKNIQNVLP
ncbi:hypothetical protein XaC1_527 [Xanthomonas phage XaC1]|nr:hypothetical protein XaC1_527 [Xanthomonas phage XaC1]